MIMATILDAALRSLLLAILVWSALRIFRVRNVLAERAAWAAVLASALLMPAVLPLSSQWRILPSETLVIPSKFVPVESAPPRGQQPASAQIPAGFVATAAPAFPDAPVAAGHELRLPDQSPAPAIPGNWRSAIRSARQLIVSLQPAT